MSVIDTIVGSLAPHVCIGCGSEGSALCRECEELAGTPPSPRCAGCRSLSKSYETCKSCRKWLPLSNVYVATTFDGAEEQLLHAYKFHSQRPAAKPIARVLASAYPKNLDIDVVTWVPTAPARVRTRGFDHAAALAAHTAKQLALAKPQSLLSRSTNWRQVGSSRAERLKHMEKEFSARKKDVTKKRVLLIDDVVTTGASLAAAAKTLKKMGAKEVIGLVYSQKA